MEIQDLPQKIKDDIENDTWEYVSCEEHGIDMLIVLSRNRKHPFVFKVFKILIDSEPWIPIEYVTDLIAQRKIMNMMNANEGDVNHA